MGFNSFGYIILFLPSVLLLSTLARRLNVVKGPQICLLLASLFFYASGNVSYLPYLVGSIIANWKVGALIGQSEGDNRKRWLQFGLVANILFLWYFKYLHFFLDSIQVFLHRKVAAPASGFPLGISFFTLAQIVYLMDCYEFIVQPLGLLDHATFVSFFPYVISGPISRSKRMVAQFAQFNKRTKPSAEHVARALFLFSLGLAKKVVLAEAFSKLADSGFDNISSLSSEWSWVVATSYILQLYFDFSGYCDMAIASALFLGIDIPVNFRAPLRSRSIIEFWQRWHITLSNFITTYLYTPLVRSFTRATLMTASICTLLAMAVAGLWHGPSWTYVVFGVLHGLALSCNQFWRKKMPKIPGWLGWLFTMMFLDVAFVFFRSPDLPTAIRFLSHMFSNRELFGTQFVLNRILYGSLEPIYLLIQLLGVGFAFFGKSAEQLDNNFTPCVRTLAVTVGCFLISFLFINSNVAKPFIYFGF